MAEEAHERIAELREQRRVQHKGNHRVDGGDDDDHAMEVIVVRD